MRIIKMLIDSKEFEIELYDNGSVDALYESLPQNISMSRWGGEYYGSLSGRIPSKGKTTEYFKEGEVALWPTGNAFCIFFGPTPVSHDGRPKMASPGVPFGKIVKGSLDDLDTMGGRIDIELVK